MCNLVFFRLIARHKIIHVNTNTRMGDLRNLMKDVRFGDGNIATDSVLRPMLNSLGRSGNSGTLNELLPSKE